MHTVDFSRRSTLSEWMDSESSSYDEFRECLVDLARVNALTQAHRPTLRFFERLRRSGQLRDRRLTILDAGSGYGDLLRQLARWARRHRIDVALTGVDLNRWSVRAAAEATPAHEPIVWVLADALEYEPHEGVDVVVSSLFTHHLTDGQIVRFLSRIDRAARLGWFVNDLHRHPVPYFVFRHWSRVAGWHRFVQHDGPVSIARAFDRRDWTRLVAEAGIDPRSVRIEWTFPFRLTVAKRARSS